MFFLSWTTCLNEWTDQKLQKKGIVVVVIGEKQFFPIDQNILSVTAFGQGCVTKTSSFLPFVANESNLDQSHRKIRQSEGALKNTRSFYALTKTEITYPKNVRAKVAMDFTQDKYTAPHDNWKIKILGAVSELPAKQRCQFGQFGPIFR